MICIDILSLMCIILLKGHPEFMLEFSMKNTCILISLKNQIMSTYIKLTEQNKQP